MILKTLHQNARTPARAKTDREPLLSQPCADPHSHTRTHQQTQLCADPHSHTRAHQQAQPCTCALSRGHTCSRPRLAPPGSNPFRGCLYCTPTNACAYDRACIRARTYVRRYCARMTRTYGRCEPTISLVFCKFLWISFTRECVYRPSRARARYC